MIRKQRTADDGGIKINIFIRVTESVYVEMLYYIVDKLKNISKTRGKEEIKNRDKIIK